MSETDTTEITDFRGEHFFLSNFYPVAGGVAYDGWVYNTSENAYQAAKTFDKRLREWIAGMTPADAKKHGRFLELRSDWEDIKVNEMHEILLAKFDPHQHPDLAQMLLDTGEAELIEGNDWGDIFWGATLEISSAAIYLKKERVGEWRGQNHLGKLLMEVRDYLRRRNTMKVV